jgi:hypothetical protein
MMILSHIHGPQAWRGYWMILQVLGQQMQVGRSMMILSHIHGPLAWRGYWMILQVLGLHYVGLSDKVDDRD